MKVLDYVKNHITYMDGGMGTLLQEEGLKSGELPEYWNLTHPDVIRNIHQRYFDVGSNIVTTNTFGANCLKFQEEELERIISAAITHVREAAVRSIGTQEKFVALDIGSIGKLLKPFGDFAFEEAVETYAKTVRLGAKYGADLILIETMNDSYDTKAALLAAKENCDLPVFVSNAYGEDGKLMTGATAAAMVAMLEGMHADVIGVNCSLGPKHLAGVVKEYLEYASVPVILMPNAGIPRTDNGKTVFDVHAEEFSADMVNFIKAGIRIAGGCCGTTPDYIQAVVNKSAHLTPVPITEKTDTMISSYTHAVILGDTPVLIGERINPTGKKAFKEALRKHDVDYILGEGIAQQELGVQVLDVNVGLPEIDERAMLKEITYELQSIIDLPLQIDTTDVQAMEEALRVYNGKAMINSVNGKQEVMEQIFPLVQKYGGLVVCLTLDEEGIPDNAERRIEIANKIIKQAAAYGIKKKDLIFDTLAMTVSADKNAALATLQSLRYIRKEMGCHTSLGVSNVSFGLPCRDVITSVFFTMAMENGLSAAIMNPKSNEMMKAYYAFRALHGLDDNCGDYIERIGNYVSVSTAQGNMAPKPDTMEKSSMLAATGASDKPVLTELQRAIVKGLKEQAAVLTQELLETQEPLNIVQEQVIPALDVVGQGFEKKTMYLPQLLMSAEAAQSAFERIKEQMSKDTSASVSRGKFVIATVRGDIHDIGKNIVKLILENYGFEVIDLGKDVPPEEIVKVVVEEQVPMVGLSALMTTTVPAMEETIKLLRKAAPWAKVAVGGAVLTQEYADSIGADFYGKDAMATVRYAVQNI